MNRLNCLMAFLISLVLAGIATIGARLVLGEHKGKRAAAIRAELDVAGKALASGVQIVDMKRTAEGRGTRVRVKVTNRHHSEILGVDAIHVSLGGARARIPVEDGFPLQAGASFEAEVSVSKSSLPDLGSVRVEGVRLQPRRSRGPSDDFFWGLYGVLFGVFLVIGGVVVVRKGRAEAQEISAK